jgi:fatty acid desaturase
MSFLLSVRLDRIAKSQKARYKHGCEVVLWSYGLMVLWSYGLMVLWSYGLMVLWSYAAATTANYYFSFHF